MWNIINRIKKVIKTCDAVNDKKKNLSSVEDDRTTAGESVDSEVGTNAPTTVTLTRITR